MAYYYNGNIKSHQLTVSFHFSTLYKIFLYLIRICTQIPGKHSTQWMNVSLSTCHRSDTDKDAFINFVSFSHSVSRRPSWPFRGSAPPRSSVQSVKGAQIAHDAGCCCVVQKASHRQWATQWAWLCHSPGGCHANDTKSPLARLRGKERGGKSLALRRVHIEREALPRGPFTSPLCLLHHYSCEEENWLLSDQKWSSWGNSVAEAGCSDVVLFKKGGGGS